MSRHHFTDRELEFFKLVVQGESPSEIARTLNVTDQTVKYRLGNIFGRIDAPNRAADPLVAGTWLRCSTGRSWLRALQVIRPADRRDSR